MALGLVASGDENGARTIERALLEQHGQELGPWVRLDVDRPAGGDDGGDRHARPRGDGDRRPAGSADGSLRARDADDGGDLRPARDRRDPLEPGSAAARRPPGSPGRSTARGTWRRWSPAPAGPRRSPNGSARGSASRPLAGDLAVVASWTRTPGPADLPSGGLVTISRTVTPVDDAPATGLVQGPAPGRLRPEGPDRLLGGHGPDAVRAGPGGRRSRLGAGRRDSARSAIAPWEVSGQRVSWCIEPGKIRDFTLGYSARVVSPGTFTWEPAVVQSVAAPDGRGDHAGHELHDPLTRPGSGPRPEPPRIERRRDRRRPSEHEVRDLAPGRGPRGDPPRPVAGAHEQPLQPRHGADRAGGRRRPAAGRRPASRGSGRRRRPGTKRGRAPQDPLGPGRRVRLLLEEGGADRRSRRRRSRGSSPGVDAGSSGSAAGTGGQVARPERHVHRRLLDDVARRVRQQRLDRRRPRAGGSAASARSDPPAPASTARRPPRPHRPARSGRRSRRP